MSRITIKDIAKLLQINPSTVSRALKDHPDISIQTKQTVKQLAEELGYRPNFQAIHFRNRKSGLIGLIIPDMNEFFLPSVIKAVEEVTRENGYNLIVFQSNDYLAREMEIARICQGFGVDGLLVSLSTQTENLDHLKFFSEEEVPVVIFDRILDNQEMPTVGIHDQKAAVIAVRHLIEQGYQRIGGVFGNPNLVITQHRYAGFKSALAEAGIPLQREYLGFAGNQMEAKSAMQEIMHNDPAPDAIFVMSDECLVGVMQVVYERGLKVPGQVAIAAISDGDVPYYMNPKITHILHSGYEVGKNGAMLLLNLMRQQQRPSAPQHIRVETQLVRLQST